MTWTSKRIREQFLDFFRSKQHEIVPSAPMVVKDDPTLMFTNAGMNQFKDIFLGVSAAKSPRVTDTQKCLRVSGKHNDLEEVGVDTYHHTMFEMLGNWSFGDYFKQDTINWAWELLTEVYKIDPDRIYVTIFGGDEEDGLGPDEDAKKYWSEIIAEDRILPFDKKDNFWEMGEVGPCGPCSEIHVDLRSEEERKTLDGRGLVNKDHPQVIEIWNLVFMQFNRKASKELENLPNQHVDTGMGFERLAMVLQGKTSNYDTDVFTPLLEKVEELTGIKYQAGDDQQSVAFRVIVDHVRAIAFSIADGQLPSNTGAGYVIRRILRRAIRYAYSFLDRKEAFIHELIPVLVDVMGDNFKELAAQSTLIGKVIKEEEESFLRTLERGILRISEIIKATNEKVVDGRQLFELYDTYGFPLDLTALILKENDLEIDKEGFEAELKKQKDRSRKAAKLDTEDWVVLRPDAEVEFLGYEQTEANARILQYRKVKTKKKELFQVVLDRTPFYAESGGQVGDTGFIESDGEKVSVIDTKKENNLIVHITTKLPTDPSAEFRAVVNASKRDLTCNNHTATHLLHEALRSVLGTHVEQKGSLVNADYLRFDFSHFSKMTPEELHQVEVMVNEKVRENLSLQEMRNTPIEEAKSMGAMALFGEKYGDTVRVIRFGSSVELCGGTHVNATGEIGYFKILSESAIAAGIRRIEAITAEKAEAYIDSQLDIIGNLKELMKNPPDLTKSIQDLLRQNQELTKQVEAFNKEKAIAVKNGLLNGVKEINGVKFISGKVDLEPASVKDIAYQLKGQLEDLFLVLGTESGGKATLTIMISEQLVKDRGYHAGNMIREIAKEISGGGGGQAFFATAGGKNPNGLPQALKKAESFLN